MLDKPDASEGELVLRGVSHAYRRGQLALDGIDLELRPGVTGLVGANGAGKSTLIKVAAGALRPQTGTAAAAGHDLFGKGRDDALARVAWMPQTASAPRSLTALEFVSYVTWMRGVTRKAAAELAREALDKVELGPKAEQKLRTLSGGMIRRVWLAQALAAPADVLLLDEPSTGLDPRQRETMVRLIAGLTDRTILLSSHILEDVATLAGRVVVLDSGRLAYDGAPPGSLDSAWYLNLVGDES